MPSAPQARRPRLCRPRLEVLEERCVPSTVTNLLDSGPGSLRQAILDTPAGGTVDFQPGLSGTITLTGGQLAIAKDLTITGPGADTVTISGNHASRVLNIAATSTVSVAGLTIADGFASLSGGFFTQGGGIYNAGTLSLSACTLANNSAAVSSFTAQGGGIYNTAAGTLSLNACTLANNSAAGTATGGSNSSGEGGGICSLGLLTVTDSTLRTNSASGTGNGAANGGGIYSPSGTISVIDSALVDNTAIGNGTGGAGVGVGAGIGSGGTLTIIGSTLRGNTAGSSTSSAAYGGGIYSTGALTISDSTLAGNSVSGTIVSYGGGLYTGAVPVLITRSIVSDNSADRGNGGGIANEGSLTIVDSTVSDNTAASSYGGGGIYNFSTLAVSASTLSGNTAVNSRGGAIYNYPFGGTVTLTNSTLSGNATTGSGFTEGGGIYNTGTLAVSASTLSGNASVSSGGGIFNALSGGASVALENVLLAGNTAPSSPDIVGPLTSRGHNLIGDGTGGSGFDATDLVGTAANPIDPLLGPLQNNGGPTPTMALLVGSPAIGAGDPTGAPDFDQRGPGFPRVVGGATDIGAFEVQAAPAVRSVVVNDGAAQRSLVTSLTVAFSGVVTFDPGAFEVRRQGGGLITLNVATSVVGNQTVAVLTFGGDSIINGSLPDGDYTLTVRADHVHDPSGQTPAADAVTRFFRLFGDSNGNGVIDLQDLLRFAGTFGTSAGDAGYLAYFDYYGTGRVDFGDLVQLLLRLGRHV